MTRQRRRTGPTVEQLMERLDQLLTFDPGYRRLTSGVRRSLRRFLARLDDEGRTAYLRVEQAANDRDAHLVEGVAQWAYWLGRRDALMPTPRVRVRKRAVAKLKRLREAPPR